MLKEFKPITPSTRNLVRLRYKNASKRPLLKCKIIGSKQNSGRNNLGRITSRHKGGGHKQKFRDINFFRKFDSICLVIGLEYDPNRSANIAALYDIKKKTYDYIIAPRNLNVGDVVKSGKLAEVKIGHSLSLYKIPLGSLIHCISKKKNGKSIMGRSAGTFCELLEKNNKYATIRLCSKKRINISINCRATIGAVSNELLILTNVGKAGRSRWLNKRPKVRGVAMNPIDHPHGGGEGKTSGGRTSVTPWGKPGKNKKTSRSKVKY